LIQQKLVYENINLLTHKLKVKSYLNMTKVNLILIVISRQFLQRSTYSFYARKSRMRKKQSSQQCHLTLLGPTGVKAAHWMLMKSTLGINFINVLWAAFVPVDPKSVKRYWQLDWILTLLGVTGVKAVHKYVGEIEPRFQMFL